MNIFLFGFGYAARHFADEFGGRFTSIAATTRNNNAVETLLPHVKLLQWRGDTTGPKVEMALKGAEALVVSIPPLETGDPVLDAAGPLLVNAEKLKTIIYLSTIGVYGDQRGCWIDENTPPTPQNERSKWRLAAEQNWTDVARRNNYQLHILRLAGIYGPGRNALENVRSGKARRIIKPGQVFNRIHVEDIAQTIARVIEFSKAGAVSIWNVADNEPAPPQDVLSYAAQLLKVEAPPEVPIEEAGLSPMGLSFYGENKRVSNARLKERLDVVLRYPTYREGLKALLQS